MIASLMAFAAEPPSTAVDANLQHIRDLHHIREAADDALAVAMAVANEPPRLKVGKVSYRRVTAEIGFDQITVMRLVHRGKELLTSLRSSA